jgi:glycogen phosphorylase
MRESMAQLTSRFSANRTVREYTEQHYLPAAAAYRKRTDDKGAMGKQIVDWQNNLEQKWTAMRFGEKKVESKGQKHRFEVLVYLNDIDPNAVQVELYADGINDDSPVRQVMKQIRQQDDGARVYSATVPATRPAADYTARVIPHCDGVAVPLEAARILWQ